MYPTIFAIVSVLASTASGIPIRRQEAAAGSADLLVLQFANVLEQLETEFYSQALSKFKESDFTAAGFSDAQIPIQQFTAIQSDESTHTTVLASTIQQLGAEAVSGCSFDFSSVLTDVATMAPVARLVENVGVGAYLGAAHLVSDPVLLTAAASILTVEARHQTMLNVFNGGNAIPTAFDLPLVPQEVLALAGGFISGCSVGIDALPSLTVTNSGKVSAGTSLQFDFADKSAQDESKLACQMLAPGQPFSISLPFSECVVPEGIQGPVAIYVTNDTQPLANNPRDRSLANIVAGPTMTFLDGTTEAISNLVKSSSGEGGAVSAEGSSSAGSAEGAVTSLSTTTISPEAASSIVSSAEGAAETGSASATESAAGAEGTAAALESNNAFPASANLTTGPSTDGAISVSGWAFVPKPSA